MTAVATARTHVTTTVDPLRFRRVLTAEWRKTISTRANRALVIAIVATTALTALGVYFLMPQLRDVGLTWLQLTGFVSAASGLLMPPLLILLSTSEWSTRSVMTTFTLTPRRGWVLLAKSIVAVVYSLLYFALIAGFGALVALAGSRAHDMPIEWSVPLSSVAGQLVVHLAVNVSAFLIGLAIMNGPGAIVLTLGAPVFLGAVGGFAGKAAEIIPWVSLHLALPTVVDTTTAVTASQWGALATSAALWLALPAAIGIWRTMHKEAA